jgi:hypothetical protein
MAGFLSARVILLAFAMAGLFCTLLSRVVP